MLRVSSHANGAGLSSLVISVLWSPEKLKITNDQYRSRNGSYEDHERNRYMKGDPQHIGKGIVTKEKQTRSHQRRGSNGCRLYPKKGYHVCAHTTRSPPPN